MDHEAHNSLTSYDQWLVPSKPHEDPQEEETLFGLAAEAAQPPIPSSAPSNAAVADPSRNPFGLAVGAAQPLIPFSAPST